MHLDKKNLPEIFWVHLMIFAFINRYGRRIICQDAVIEIGIV